MSQVDSTPISGPTVVEEVERLREALTEIATWAEYGYQDLNSGGVLSCVKKRARKALA